jgi:hypothetical protein
MADLLVRHPADFAAERKYALDVVLGEWLGLSYVGETHELAATVITLRGCAGELVLPDVFFARAAAAWLERGSMPESPLPRWRPNLGLGVGGDSAPEIPVLFGVPVSDGDYLELGKQHIVLGLDILGSVFFLLTRYEERVSTVRDEHDRFPGKASLACREGVLERPLANEYLEILWSLMRRLWPALQRRQRAFEISLEHDVDTPFGVVGRDWARVLKNVLGDLGRRRSPELAARRLMAKLAADGAGAARFDPNNTFDFIMATSERHGLKSTFFVKSAASDRCFDDPYPLDAPCLTAILRRIHARAHRIGLHPSYLTYRDRARLLAEFAGLREACERLGIRQAEWGGRQHYLRFAVPATWRHYAAVGLGYDATLGFDDCPGFRCGTCYEFKVYDFEERRALPLYERPLTVMEITLLDGTYLGLSPEAARERIARLAGICRRFSGCFRLLWHNSELVTRQQRRFYADIVPEIVG